MFGIVYIQDQPYRAGCNADAYAHTYADTRSNAHAYAYTCAGSNAHAYAYTNADTNSDTFGVHHFSH